LVGCERSVIEKAEGLRSFGTLVHQVVDCVGRHLSETRRDGDADTAGDAVGVGVGDADGHGVGDADGHGVGDANGPGVGDANGVGYRAGH